MTTSPTTDLSNSSAISGQSEAEISAGVLKQVDFYFSDANLQTHAYLRSLLQSNDDSAISVDQLLTFRAVAQQVGGNRDKLVTILQEGTKKFQFASYDATTNKISRRCDKPFVYDRSFLRKQKNNILYLSKLPPNTTVHDVHTWATTTFPECWVQPIKRVQEHSISTALVVFQEDKPVRKILSSTKNGSVSFGPTDSEQSLTCKAMTYPDYRKLKKKLSKKSQKPVLKGLEDLSIGDQSSENPIKKAFGTSNLIAKRTLLFTHTDKFKHHELKDIFSVVDVIFVYTISKNQSCLLFKNRAALTDFVKLLVDENFSEIVDKLSKATKSDTLPTIEKQFFAEVNLTQLPDYFAKYIKRVKSFFRNKSP